jgi:hypothetical protein
MSPNDERNQARSQSRKAVVGGEDDGGVTDEIGKETGPSIKKDTCPPRAAFAKIQRGTRKKLRDGLAADSAEVSV